MSKTLRWTLIALAAVLVIYTIGWFAIARMVDKRVEAGLEELRLGGFGPICTERTMVGFPLAMTLTCATTGAEPVNGQPWQGGALAVSAPFIDPGLFTGTLVSPLVFGEADRRVVVTWSALEARLDMALGGAMQDARLQLDAPTINAGPHTTSAALAQLTLRPDPDAPQDLRAEFVTNGLAADLPFDRALAATDLTVRASLENGVEDLIQKRLSLAEILEDGAVIEVELLRLSVGDGGSVALAGPLAASPEGLLSGTVSIGLRNRDALARWAATLNPGAAQAVATLAQAVAGMGVTRMFDGEEMSAIDLTLDDGEVRLGFIRLGRIPPLQLR